MFLRKNKKRKFNQFQFQNPSSRDNDQIFFFLLGINFRTKRKIYAHIMGKIPEVFFISNRLNSTNILNRHIETEYMKNDVDESIHRLITNLSIW